MINIDLEQKLKFKDLKESLIFGTFGHIVVIVVEKEEFHD